MANGLPLAPSWTTLRAPDSLLTPVQDPPSPKPRSILKFPGTESLEPKESAQSTQASLLPSGSSGLCSHLLCLPCGPFTWCLEKQRLWLPVEVQPARPASPGHPFPFFSFVQQTFPSPHDQWRCTGGQAERADIRTGSQVSLATMPGHPLCPEQFWGLKRPLQRWIRAAPQR